MRKPILLALMLWAGYSAKAYAGHVNHNHPAVLKNLTDTVKAKADSTDDDEPKHRKYTVELAYMSANSFKGRRDTSGHGTVSPSFNYDGKHGFNGSIAFSNAGGGSSKLDETDLAFGWDHDWTDNFSTSILETHNFFDSKSPKIKSTVDNDVNVGATYDIKKATLGLMGDWCHGPKTKVGREKDYFYTLYLSREFEFDEFLGHELDIEPKFSMVAGTQNFFSIYHKGTPTDSTVIKKIDYQKKLAQFGLLNFELSVPVTYTIKRFSFQVEWDYNIPQNVPPGESSKPYSVFCVNLLYSWKGKK